MKRLSDDPTERLAECRGEAVPPAGDVEVLLDGVFDEMSRRFELSNRDDDHMVYDDTQIGVEFAINALRPSLTRLTAERDVARRTIASMLANGWEERDTLKVQVSVAKQREYDAQVRASSLQSELTKARFLVDQALHLQKEHYGDGMGLHLAMIKWGRAARQPAPAAKDGSDE